MQVSLVQYYGCPPKTRRTPAHDVVKVGFDVAYMFIPARIYDSVSHLTQIAQLIITSFPVSVVYGQIQTPITQHHRNQLLFTSAGLGL